MTSSVELPSKEELLRSAVFVPCESKEQLRNWVATYLGLWFPDLKVDPSSTTTPMDVLWEIYSAALYNNRKDLSRFLAWSSRDSFKTLGAAVLEVLFVLHLNRSVAHMAAIEPQASKAQSYVKKFFRKPYLRDFLYGDNKRTIVVRRYHNASTGQSINHRTYNVLPPNEQAVYEEHENYITIIICTLTGANSEHVPFMVIDEVDVVPNPVAYEEAKAIPAPMGGVMPITLLTSTRKVSTGLVQKELDAAARSGLIEKHWNILDVTEQCPPERHLPDEPQITIYRSDDLLSAISEEEYSLLSERTQEKYVKDKGFKGCLQNCKLFAACKGRLATHQKGYAQREFKPGKPVVLLKPIDHVQNQFRAFSVDMVKAQLLCWKPSSQGLIYPRLARDMHVKTAAEMAEMITGDPHDSNTFTKAHLLAMLKERGTQFYGGVDWGFTHNFVFVFGAVDGNRCFILGGVSQAELDPIQKIEESVRLRDTVDPIIYADPESPSDIKLWRRHGFKIREWQKKAGSVRAGIETMRLKIYPGVGVPQLFFLAEDPIAELVFIRCAQYHFKMGPSGEMTEEPEEADDDECFTDETEVLSKRGWVSLAEVSPDDEVLAVSGVGRGTWECPEVIHKDYAGSIHSIRRPHLEFSATVRHRHSVMTQMDWKVNGEYRLTKKTIEEMCGEMYWANNLSSWESGPGLFEQGEDEAWMAGFWLAEGCFDSHRPTFILVDQTKPQHQAEVRRRALKLGWRWSETHGGASIRFCFSGQKERASKWREMFGSTSLNKKLEISSILAMSEKERSCLWEGYMAGDGSRTQSAWHFDSVSRALADGMQVLSLSVGYGCRVIDSYRCQQPGRTMTNPAGRTYLCAQSYRGHVLRKRPVAHIKKDWFVTSEYNGKVHCVRTSTGSFLARTNGKVFVAGNCDAIRYLVMNVFGIRGRLVAPMDDPTQSSITVPQHQKQYNPHNFIREIVAERTGMDLVDVDDMDEAASPTKGRTGRFIFDLG